MPSLHTTTRPPSLLPSAFNCAPWATVVALEAGSLPLPWKLPPTSTSPPDDCLPLASTLAVPASVTSSPRTLICPPFLPFALSVPATWVLAASPNTMVPLSSVTESATTLPLM